MASYYTNLCISKHGNEILTKEHNCLQMQDLQDHGVYNAKIELKNKICTVDAVNVR